MTRFAHTCACCTNSHTCTQFCTHTQDALPLLAELTETVTNGAVHLGGSGLAVQQHIGKLAGGMVSARTFNGQLWQVGHRS
jgi:hypothetical protein